MKRAKRQCLIFQAPILHIILLNRSYKCNFRLLADWNQALVNVPPFIKSSIFPPRNERHLQGRPDPLPLGRQVGLLLLRPRNGRGQQQQQRLGTGFAAGESQSFQHSTEKDCHIRQLMVTVHHYISLFSRTVVQCHLLWRSGL